MKRKLTHAAFLLLLTASSLAAFAQSDKVLRKIYLQSGAGPASRSGYFDHIGLQSVLKNNWVASLSVHQVGGTPKNLPADYQPGYTTLLFFPIPDGLPESRLNLYSLTGGKLFETGRNTWVSTEAGVSLVKGETFTFQRQEVTEGGLVGLMGYITSNYNTTTREKTTVGAIVKADFTWAFASFAGLGGGVFVRTNPMQSPVGGELKLVLGWTDRKGRKSKT